MSLTQALSTSMAGLRATQAGLNLVATNVANAGTAGYVKKTLSQTTTAVGTTSVSVMVSGIDRVIDQYLRSQTRVETSAAAYADTKANFYGRMQLIYGDPGSVGPLESVFNDFTAALQALSTSSENYSARSSVLNTAQALTQQLNSQSNAIQALRSDAEQSLSAAVQSANAAMQQIASINQKLAASTSNDATTATLLDQRDLALDQLAQLMDIKVANGPNNTVTVFTNSGIQLVGNEAAQLQFDTHGRINAASAWNADPNQRSVGTITLISPSGSSMDLVANGAIKSGEIAAYLQMRDQILPQAQTQLDEIAAAMARALSDTTVAGSPVSAGSQSGFDIDLGGLQAGNTVRVSYTDLATGAQRTITFVRVDDPSVLPLADDVTADPNDKVVSVNFSGGLASALAQINQAFNGAVQVSNPSDSILRIVNSASNNVHIDAVSSVQTATSLSGGVQLPFFTDGSSTYTAAITATGSQSVGLAGRITVNPALLADPSMLASYDSSGGAGDATRANFIYGQLTSATLVYSPQTGIGSSASPFSGTLTAFMQQIMSEQGQAASAAQDAATAHLATLSALQQRLDADSGVNIDEEMANLLNLQNAYAANARIMSAIKDMFDILLRM